MSGEDPEEGLAFMSWGFPKFGNQFFGGTLSMEASFVGVGPATYENACFLTNRKFMSPAWPVYTATNDLPESRSLDDDAFTLRHASLLLFP